MFRYSKPLQDYLKIQSDLNKLFELCGAFSRLRHPVEFSYILEGFILDRVDFISDLRVLMHSRMVFAEHVDFAVGKALAMLRIVKRMSIVKLLCSKLEYASCVWRIENVQKRFVKYALGGL
jgi:hypothetical protein